MKANCDDAPGSAYVQSVIAISREMNQPWRGIVTPDNWKYICLEHQPWLMFNLNDDPYEQVNLVHNGIKFTPSPGEVKVVAERVNGEVIVRLADTGPGIPPEALPRLFERFYQAGDQAARRTGMGIGLYFSRRIVEAHGGRIWVSSELGHGSTFCVALPVPATKETGAQAE